jgi:DNA-binding XRE family transcriptional regulator
MQSPDDSSDLESAELPHIVNRWSDLPKDAQLRLQLIRARHETTLQQILVDLMEKDRGSELRLTSAEASQLMRSTMNMAVELGEEEARERLVLKGRPVEFNHHCNEILHAAGRTAELLWLDSLERLGREADIEIPKEMHRLIRTKLRQTLQRLILQAWSNEEKRLAAEVSPHTLQFVDRKGGTSTVLAENFRRLREARGLSVEALAIEVDLDKKTIQRIERGEQPSRVTLKKLARAFGKSITELS